ERAGSRPEHGCAAAADGDGDGDDAGDQDRRAPRGRPQRAGLLLGEAGEHRGAPQGEEVGAASPSPPSTGPEVHGEAGMQRLEVDGAMGPWGYRGPMVGHSLAPHRPACLASLHPHAPSASPPPRVTVWEGRSLPVPAPPYHRPPNTIDPGTSDPTLG